MSCLSPLASAGNFFKGVSVPSLGTVVEGGIWGGYFGIQVFWLKEAITKKGEADALPPNDPSKVNKLWNAKKDLFLGSVMTVSSSSMLATWAESIGVIELGSIGSIISSFGYIGSVLASSVRLWDALKDLKETTLDFGSAIGISAKRDIALKHVDHLLSIAFFVSFIAWGVLGIVSLCTATPALLALVDKCFLYGALIFVLRLGYVIFFLPLPKREKNPA